ncbi:MAG TPA: hypothetical protein VG146_00655, partial [Verrucomicrobiae bacterium]|nr:hypothetical protein [Verrucomicrobiae bacterium]
AIGGLLTICHVGFAISVIDPRLKSQFSNLQALPNRHLRLPTAYANCTWLHVTLSFPLRSRSNLFSGRLHTP